MGPTKKYNNVTYCKKYRETNLEEIRKKGRERKKLEREYVKYCEPNKYKDYLEKERERKQIGKYKLTHFINY